MLYKETIIIMLFISWICVLAAIVYVMFAKDILLATISLIVIYLLSAVILLILGIEFIGLLYITVYVGAVSVFIIMVLMLFNLRDLLIIEEEPQFFYNFGFSLLISINLFVSLQYLICKNMFQYKTIDEIRILKYYNHKMNSDLNMINKNDILYDLINSFDTNKSQILITELQDQILFIRAWYEVKASCNNTQRPNLISYSEFFMDLLEQNKFVMLQEIGITLYNENYIAFISITILLLIILISTVAIIFNKIRDFF